VDIQGLFFLSKPVHVAVKKNLMYNLRSNQIIVNYSLINKITKYTIRKFIIY